MRAGGGELERPAGRARGANGHRAPDPCADAQTQLALTECADRQYREADAALNSAYRPLLAALDDPHRERRRRTARLARVSGRRVPAGRVGRARRIDGAAARAECRKDMTQARVKELASIRESLAESMR